MDKPSEEARYLASWLTQFYATQRPNDYTAEIEWEIQYKDENELVEILDEYFNSRR